MKIRSTIALAAALTAHAGATTQRNSEPRTPAPIPVQSSAKVPATGPATHATIAEATASLAPSRGAGGARAKPSGPEPLERAVRVARPDELYFAVENDGATWVRGRTYKARFGAGGATYVPFFGSRAPRNFPVEMSLARASVDGVDVPLSAATAAVRDGDRIVIDRGPIDEVYEVALDHVEQTFVVAERPASGDLKLFVSLQSELARGETADGVVLSNEHGSVRYGRAFVREADGDRVPVASRLVAGGVEIEVAQEYLATAEFPLVVDPVVSTFLLDNFGRDQVEVDTSYDASTDRYLIAYEEIFSATDHDVFAQLYSGTGVVFAANYLDISTENWLGPQTGNLNAADQFLCAAQVGNVLGSTGYVIRGMTVEAATFDQSLKFNISTPEQTGDKVLADVGGDPFDGSVSSAYYCVVWRRDFASDDTDVHARLVTSSATLVGLGTLLIDNSGATIDDWPSVSKSDGQLGGSAAWTIAWHRYVSPTNWDIYAARLRWDGATLDASAPIATNGFAEYYPRAASPLDDGSTMLVWARSNTTDHDLHYGLMQNGVLVSTGNLTHLDAPFSTTQNQIEYSIDSDGERFVVAYADNYNGDAFDYDTWISTFVPSGTELRCAEARQSLDFTGEQSLRTDVVSTYSGGGAERRFLAVWDTTVNGGQRDIFGAFYDRPLGGGQRNFCAGDGSGITCPCGNTGAFQHGCANSVDSEGAYLRVTSGVAQPGSGDTTRFLVYGVPSTVACTLFQGTTGSSTGSPFGDGQRCVGGTQIRIGTKYSSTGGLANWPTGSEAPVSVTGLVPASGGVRYYQVSYRNAASFCTPATFNVSNGIDMQWLP